MKPGSSSRPAHASSKMGSTWSSSRTPSVAAAATRPFGLRGLRRRSVALAAVNMAAAAVGAAAEAMVVRERCGMTRERAAVGAVALTCVARIAAMVGMARSQEVTAVAVASDADRADEAPPTEFAKRETRVGRTCFSLALSSLGVHMACLHVGLVYRQ